MTLTMGTFCSGIGAPEMAGFATPLWVSEIDPRACHVLHFKFGSSRPQVMPDPQEAMRLAVLEPSEEAIKEVYDRRRAIRAVADLPETGAIPNLGDMTATDIVDRIEAAGVPDIVVAGLPCQPFSVAGLRKGEEDPRNLTARFVEIANDLDAIRRRNGKPPVWFWIENVPGLLSHWKNPFGSLMGGLVGGRSAAQPPGKKWRNRGVVAGPARTAAWRVLDSRYFGVAQRRKRVFVLARGGSDKWACADALLPISKGLCGDPEKGRREGQSVAALTANGAGASGVDDNATQAGHVIAAYGGGNCSGPVDVAATLAARGTRQDFEVETFVASVTPPLTTQPYGDHESRDGLLVASVTGDVTHALDTANGGKMSSEDGTGRGVPVVAAYRTSPNCGAWDTGDRVDALTTGTDPASHLIAFDTTQTTSGQNGSNPQPGDPCHPQAGAAHPPAIAFSCKDDGGDASAVAPTLRAMGAAASHANSGGQLAVAIQERAIEEGRGGPGGKGRQEDVAYTLEARHRPQNVGVGMDVRRLLPVECQRLQDFPDNFFDGVLYRGSPLSDGPKYRMLGNSMTVSVIRWIGLRIVEIHGRVESS